MFQRTRANLARMEVGVQQAYVRSRTGVYRDVADLLITMGRLVEAQEALDLLKEEELRDYLRRRGASELSSAGLTEAELALERRLREISGRLFEIGREHAELAAIRNPTPDETRRLQALEADLALANRAFEDALAGIAADLGGGRAAATEVYEIREAQGLMGTLGELGAGSVAVYTLVTPTRYHAIVITASARKAVSVDIDEADLNRRIFAFRQLLQNPQLDPRPAARRLYDVLVAPIAADLQQAGARTVMWVLDGALRYVPMAALHDGRQYIAESYRTVMMTPASRDNLRDQPSAHWSGVGLGVSRPIGGFAALPAVSEELRRIFRAPPQSGGILDGRILLDDAFTADTFRASLRQRATVVHIASHFQFRPGNERDSFLLLGDGNRMTLAEFNVATRLFDGVELLTLSACDTAVGDAGATGAEVESLGAQAQRLGAKAVVASLWAVADTSTMSLMERFYRTKVEGGLDKAEALRQAQLALLTGSAVPEMRADEAGRDRGLRTAAAPRFTPPASAPWAHPYYWAPFVLIGNWR